MTADQQGITDPATNQFIQNGEIRYYNGTPEYGSVQDKIFYNDTNTLAQLPNGKWVTGTVENNAFVSPLEVNGQTMQGTYDSDSGFTALDHKTYVPDGGPPQQGIYDQTNNLFIQNGEIRYYNGTPEYGSVQGKIFYNDTNTLAQLPNGKWVTGTVENNAFVSPLEVNGQTMQGTYDSDSGFTALDHKTYVPDGGPPQQGIYDQTNNLFIQNGEIRYYNGTPEYGSVQNNIFYNDTNTLEELPGGQWEPGKLENNAFVSTYVYQGQTLEGYYDPAGDFLLKSGLGEIPATGPEAGQEEPGLTDPGTGDFIPGATVMTIDGVQYYGVVQDGIFYADNNTLAYILSADLVIHGETVNNTFLATYEYQGQTLKGYYDGKSDFFLQSGLGEIAATGPDAGKLVPGVTDPATGDFVPGGVAKTMPDGTILYGFMAGNDFVTYDYTKIVFDGTVVTGTYDQKTGIFTAADGSLYFIGQDGIQPATQQSDSSYLLADGSVVMTPHAYSVQLPVFFEAISNVVVYADLINIATATISAQYSKIESAWQSPAGLTFGDVANRADAAMAQLNIMLADMVYRMKLSYANYLAAEAAAVQSFST